MPKVKVESKSGLTQADAYSRVKNLLQNDKDIRKMDPSCEFTFDDAAHSGTAKGSMFKAELAVSAAGSGSNVTVEIDLPIMLMAVKGMVQSTLEKKLTTALA